METVLQLYFNGQIIFNSSKKWLHPLLDLELFLNGQPQYQADQLMLFDKVIGKAAALLIVRLGLKKIKTRLISQPAEMVFQSNQIQYQAEQTVEKITCQTEDLLQKINEPETAYQIIKKRALKNSDEKGKF